MLSGKKSYILSALTLISAVSVYAIDVITNGFNFEHFMVFVGSSAVAGAIATLRAAISKKA